MQELKGGKALPAVKVVHAGQADLPQRGHGPMEGLGDRLNRWLGNGIHGEPHGAFFVENAVQAAVRAAPQLPLVRPGVFILPSLPTPRISCSEMIAMRATDIRANRISAQFNSSPVPPM
jgi:hypothetical protein